MNFIGGEVFGIRAGKTTKGHPVLCTKEIAPQNANEYESVMRKSGKVIADMNVRRELIREKLEKSAKMASSVYDDIRFNSILYEVRNMCENARRLCWHDGRRRNAAGFLHY